MNFLVDEQLPPALAVWLRSQGYQATHIHDLGLGAAGDNDIWEVCLRDETIIITKDRDFALRRAVTNGPRIVWVRLGNMKVGDMMRRFRVA